MIFLYTKSLILYIIRFVRGLVALSFFLCFTLLLIHEYLESSHAVRTTPPRSSPTRRKSHHGKTRRSHARLLHIMFHLLLRPLPIPLLTSNSNLAHHAAAEKSQKGDDIAHQCHFLAFAGRCIVDDSIFVASNSLTLTILLFSVSSFTITIRKRHACEYGCTKTHACKLKDKLSGLMNT